MKKALALRYALLAAVLGAFLCGIVARVLRASAATEVPRVELNADNLGPRVIEDLTSKSIPRDYGLAWQTMEQALEENRPGLLDGYFTGLAKQGLTERVNSQLKSGLQTRIADRGHHLAAGARLLHARAAGHRRLARSGSRAANELGPDF